MRLIEINPVGFQARQALLEFKAHRVGAEEFVDRSAFGDEVTLAFCGIPTQPTLSREHDLVATTGNRLADDFL